MNSNTTISSTRTNCAVSSTIIDATIDSNTPTVNCILETEAVKAIIDSIITIEGNGSPTQVRMYVFQTPSNYWLVQHNLGRRVVVDVYTVGGVSVEAKVTHIDDNVVRIDFTSQMVGYVLLV